MTRWSQQERTATLVVVLGFLAVALGVHYVWSLEDRYEDAMARWCPYWSTMPARCETGRLGVAQE